MDANLKLEYLPIAALTPYEKNTRRHEDLDIDNIARSIERYGMNDAIGVWGDQNIIVEGHGRLLACKKLGIETVPVVRLDHLTDEQRREYAIAHNATAELSVWDMDSLAAELSELDLSGFDFAFLDDGPEAEEKENPYTDKIKIPQYEITGEQPGLTDLVNEEKTAELEWEIEHSGVSDDEKAFLRKAAARHLVFDYRNIAEYYASASPEMQMLMEKSALVIIDYEDAIANGYVRLSKRLKEMRNRAT